MKAHRGPPVPLAKPQTRADRLTEGKALLREYCAATTTNWRRRKIVKILFGSKVIQP